MSPESDDRTEDDSDPVIIIEPAQLAGVWANVVNVAVTRHEFTIDFIRMDAAAAAPGLGIVVARVAFSPFLASQLTALLGEVWQWYADVPDHPWEGRDGRQEPEADDEKGVEGGT